jgi:hypothetical protein
MIGLTPGVGKKIESPLSAFNNLLIQISDKIELIYFPKKKEKNISFINKLLFEEKSITIFGNIKIIFEKNEIGLKFCGFFTDTSLIKITLENQAELFQIFQNYLYIIDSLTMNFDDSISQKHVESLFNQIKSGKVDSNQFFILPYKNKINHLYDSSKNDKSLEKLFNRFSYVIKFNVENKQTFQYKFYRVLSTNLNESKSLENIRFEDIELLKENNVSFSKLQHFLVDLFYYGNLN